jgi:hypothetical protein
LNEKIVSNKGEKQKEVNMLSELALDMRWSWDHSAVEIWR